MVNWKNILSRAEESLVQLLLTESQKVIKKLNSDIENELQNFGYENRDQVYLGLEQKHTSFKKSSEKRRSKKWQRFWNSIIKNFKLTHHIMSNQK